MHVVCVHHENVMLILFVLFIWQLNSYFRPFRAGIFAKWLDPRTPIWYTKLVFAKVSLSD